MELGCRLRLEVKQIQMPWLLPETEAGRQPVDGDRVSGREDQAEISGEPECIGVEGGVWGREVRERCLQEGDQNAPRNSGRP